MSIRPRRAPSDGPLVLGIVGRTGSGKSTVARALADAGAVVLEADRLGHEVTDTDPEVRAELMSEYGVDVYLPDGKLDRAKVAKSVFRDPEARLRLDLLVHPRIIARIHARYAELKAAKFRGAMVIDAALLLDWGLERECDWVVAVVAPEAVQIERLASSRGWSREHAAERLAVQRSDAEFRAAADVTFENDGSREALEARAREMLGRLLAARENPGASSAERH
jgi:dephospho-CoA kinase